MEYHSSRAPYSGTNSSGRQKAPGSHHFNPPHQRPWATFQREFDITEGHHQPQTSLVLRNRAHPANRSFADDQRRSPSHDRPSSPTVPPSPKPPSSQTEWDLVSDQNYQVIQFHSKSQPDTTLHFVLDVTDDIEGHLEEVACLKRWGHFKDALEYFTVKLKDHLSIRFVATEYASLLLAQGSYRTLAEQQREVLKHKTPVIEDDEASTLYVAQFEGARFRAFLHFEDLAISDLEYADVSKILDAINDWVNSRSLDDEFAQGPCKRLNYAQVRVICDRTEMLGLAQLARYDDKRSLPQPEFRHWTELYDDLLLEGRIWEFSDLFRAMISYYGLFRACRKLGFVSSECERGTLGTLVEPMEQLCQEWSTNDYDESTELAILTLLLHFMHGAYLMLLSLEGVENAEMKPILQKASFRAARIRHNSPHLVRSRPYLQWLLAREFFDRYLNPSREYRDYKRQIHILPGPYYELPLPMYVPQKFENTGRWMVDPAFPPNDTLQWVLATSRELGDYKVESMCLMELINRAEDPTTLLQELEHLQRVTQGDHLGYLETCIAQYQLSTDEASRRGLIEKLHYLETLFGPLAEDKVSDLMRENALRVLIALYRPFAEYGSKRNEISSTLRMLYDHRNAKDTEHGITGEDYGERENVVERRKPGTGANKRLDDPLEADKHHPSKPSIRDAETREETDLVIRRRPWTRPNLELDDIAETEERPSSSTSAPNEPVKTMNAPPKKENEGKRDEEQEPKRLQRQPTVSDADKSMTEEEEARWAELVRGPPVEEDV